MITDFGKHNTRGMIIEILTEEFPLSAKKIYNQIKKTGRSVTYHAVYDRISEMVKEGVLVKRDFGYHISSKWIEKVSDVINKINIQYAKKLETGPLAHAESIGHVKHLTFKSLKSYHKFLLGFKKKFTEETVKKGDNKICWITDHSWWTILHMGDYADLFRNMKKTGTNHYMLIRGNTPIDKSVGKFLRDSGLKNTKIGFKDGEKTIIGIYGDTMIYLLYPQGFLKAVDALFNSAKDIKGLDLNKFFKSIEDKKMRFQALIITDNALVQSKKKYIVKNASKR
jgi:hypothetical protein